MTANVWSLENNGLLQYNLYKKIVGMGYRLIFVLISDICIELIYGQNSETRIRRYPIFEK